MDGSHNNSEEYSLYDFTKMNASLRKSIKDELKRGATHTEIALKLLTSEDVKIRINPKILTPDAVIARFVCENPKLAVQHKELLIEASKMNYDLNKSNHKAFAIWALISSHLFYPEISGVHFAHHSSLQEAEPHLKELYSNLEKILREEHGNHINVIAQFTDFIAKETANVRGYLSEEEDRLSLVSENPQKILDILRKKGHRVIVLKEGEKLDPFALNVAAHSNERIFIIVKKQNGKMKVLLRAVNGRLGANLYRALNEEERKIRKTKDLVDEWNGSHMAGGSPLDGTEIPLERIALILALHT